MKILVVDDNDLNRLLATNVMEDQGWMVREARGGLEAMQHLEQEEFDAVLLDVSMPHMGGDQLVQWIRAEEGLAKMPVIAYTAHVMPSDVQRLRDVGFDHVIGKPVSVEELASQVREHLPFAA